VNKYREQFSLDAQVAYLNHGSFAFVPNASQGVITAVSSLVTKPRAQSSLRIAEIEFTAGVQTADDILDAFAKVASSYFNQKLK